MSKIIRRVTMIVAVMILAVASLVGLQPSQAQAGGYWITNSKSSGHGFTIFQYKNCTGRRAFLYPGQTSNHDYYWKAYQLSDYNWSTVSLTYVPPVRYTVHNTTGRYQCRLAGRWPDDWKIYQRRTK